MDKIALTADELNDLVKITAPDIPSDLGGIVNELVKYIFPAAGIALLIYIIIGGYQMMLSGGDPKNIAKCNVLNLKLWTNSPSTLEIRFLAQPTVSQNNRGRWEV